MRTYTEKIQQGRKHRMPIGGVLMECLRQLHPGVQFDHGCGFFLYILSIGITVTGLIELPTRRADSTVLLLVALTLWMTLLLGNLLVVVFGPGELETLAPSEPPPQVADGTSSGTQGPNGRGPRTVVDTSGEDWQVSLEAKDHDD